MPRSLAYFNHKGGVGKTTLLIRQREDETRAKIPRAGADEKRPRWPDCFQLQLAGAIVVNTARAFGQLGLRTLVVDADPQCNATAFYLDETKVDALLDDSVDPEDGGTLWSGIAKYVRARGEVRKVPTHEVGENVFLLPGDVLLGGFEDRLSAAWKDSFSRDATAIDLLSAIHRSVTKTAEAVSANLVLFDVGPSIGSLNRAIMLGCDFYAVPVACDLFSLRALRTVGQTLPSWTADWKTVRTLAKSLSDVTLLPGKPVLLGYITQHFNIYRDRATSSFDVWEKKIAPRFGRDVLEPIRKIDSKLAPAFPSNKLGEIPNYHSLAPQSQNLGIPIGGLKGCESINSGYYPKIEDADTKFQAVANELRRRIGI